MQHLIVFGSKMLTFNDKSEKREVYKDVINEKSLDVSKKWGRDASCCSTVTNSTSLIFVISVESKLSSYVF